MLKCVYVSVFVSHTEAAATSITAESAGDIADAAVVDFLWLMNEISQAVDSHHQTKHRHNPHPQQHQQPRTHHGSHSSDEQSSSSLTWISRRSLTSILSEVSRSSRSSNPASATTFNSFPRKAAPAASRQRPHQQRFSKKRSSLLPAETASAAGPPTKLTAAAPSTRRLQRSNPNAKAEAAFPGFCWCLCGCCYRGCCSGFWWVGFYCGCC